LHASADSADSGFVAVKAETCQQYALPLDKPEPMVSVTAEVVVALDFAAPLRPCQTLYWTPVTGFPSVSAVTGFQVRIAWLAAWAWIVEARHMSAGMR
jgi:hypothetical protein